VNNLKNPRAIFPQFAALKNGIKSPKKLQKDGFTIKVK
jgi:hypothetical protein